MSKSKAARARQNARQASSRAQENRPSKSPARPGPNQAVRETVESIAVAVILAFLFRAFVAEAFVIPTGSMAPTLMGEHKDVKCPECDYWYQAGASTENQENRNGRRVMSHRVVVTTTCPLCRYQRVLDLEGDANTASFSGDRILVSKFVYDFTSPKRWDVIVFKFPSNAKQNYIKRLIGLPGESIRIRHGDIHVRATGEDEYQIARKPDHKLWAMLQLVDDSKHISKKLTTVGWPHRWRPWGADNADVTDLWTSDDGGHSYSTQADTKQDIWIRYHHVLPTANKWLEIEELLKNGETLPDPDSNRDSLITDFYAYNAYTSIDRSDLRSFRPTDAIDELPLDYMSQKPNHEIGFHWVGDLAFEGDVDIQGDTGELLLQLTKGGVVYLCRIDIATGAATVSIDDGAGEFTAGDGATATKPAGETKIRGQGKHTIKFSNVDSELRLWVDSDRIAFDGPTTYLPPSQSKPKATLENPGDLAPLGIGTRGAPIHVRRLRVLRDIYYIAANESSKGHEYTNPLEIQYSIPMILSDSATWDSTRLFDNRGTLEVELGADQFMPLGDNSPQSSDARMWEGDPFVTRDLLIGRALLIYWPHPWYRPIPYLPNVKRMQLIH